MDEAEGALLTGTWAPSEQPANEPSSTIKVAPNNVVDDLFGEKRENSQVRHRKALKKAASAGDEEARIAIMQVNDLQKELTERGLVPPISWRELGKKQLIAWVIKLHQMEKEGKTG